MIAAGQLKYQVRIERMVEPTPTDSYGRPVPTWETFATRRAKIVSSASSETIEQQGNYALKSWTITIRRLDELDESMRVVFTWKGRERTAYLTSLDEAEEDDTTFGVSERE